MAFHPHLTKLQPYPFEKLKRLFAGVTPNPAYSAISLGIGEPKHPTPAFIKQALIDNLDGLASYPATAGSEALRTAISDWITRRYSIPALDPATQILPVNGSREALFALAQTIINTEENSSGSPLILCPNPFYQIYEGAAYLSGAETYFKAEAPLGSLQAAQLLGRHDYPRLITLSSLSKRSNVPGMRSGFVAGDAEIIKNFLLYRTYHGNAMSPVIQAASVFAWKDEAHVEENRAKYVKKFAQITPILEEVLDVKLPDAAFYLWAKVDHLNGINDVEFAKRLYEKYNVTVLPGSYLAREAHGINPGQNRIRMALVAEVEECFEAAQRIVAFCKELTI